jgi:methyl coenzyme M reductase alpha subunit
MDRCIELAEELIEALKEAGHTDQIQTIQSLIDGLKAEYEDEPEESDSYESEDMGPKDRNPDEELEEFAKSEVEKKGKPALVIRIKTK